MRGRPAPALAQAPKIDEIADQIEPFAVHGSKKIQQKLRLAILETQVDIGNPDRSKVVGLHDSASRRQGRRTLAKDAGGV
jgi:hypothetical protein